MANAVVIKKDDQPAVHSDWKTIGWQGITIQAPPEWDLAGYGGDVKSGNLRLDNSDPEARTVIGMEVRWSPQKGKVTDDDLRKRLDILFAGLTKDAKRQKTSIETKSKEIDVPDYPERTTRSYTWQSNQKSIGRIWHCPVCNRIVIAQIIGNNRKDFNRIATDVLASMQCHSSETEWQAWSLYDLLSQVPSDYRLNRKPQLMNIYVQLAFNRGQSQDALSLEQWGIANVQLKGTYLDQWFRKKNSTMEPMLSYDCEEGEAHGHTALRMTGRCTGWWYWLTQGLALIAKLKRPAIYYEACLWECPESNKIHLVQSFSRRRQPSLVQEIVERTKCHC